MGHLLLYYRVCVFVKMAVITIFSSPDHWSFSWRSLLRLSVFSLSINQFNPLICITFGVYFSPSSSFIILIKNNTLLPCQDPFGEKRGVYDFASIRKRLEAIKQRLDQKAAKKAAADEESSENENAES